jgi:integrase
VRALIVMLWRGGLRVQEALALRERDLDRRRGSVLVANGKGGRRREVGMDAWAWEQLRPWLAACIELPVGPLICIIDGPTRGRLGHVNLGRTSIYLQGIDTEEIIATVRARRAPMMSATAGLRF